MTEWAQGTYEVIASHPFISFIIGLMLLFITAMLLVSFLYFMQWLLQHLCSSSTLIQRWLEHIRAITTFFKLYPKIFWMLFKLICGFGIITFILCCTFAARSSSEYSFSYILAISLCGMYICFAIQQISKFDKKCREQYTKVRQYYKQFGTMRIEYKTSYVHYLLSLVCDEEHVIGWFTNVVFYICAPIALFAYTYSLFCKLDDLIYIVSFVSIALAFYSVWKTIETSRESTRKLNKVIGTIKEYKEEKPIQNDREEWIDLG